MGSFMETLLLHIKTLFKMKQFWEASFLFPDLSGPVFSFNLSCYISVSYKNTAGALPGFSERIPAWHRSCELSVE